MKLVLTLLALLLLLKFLSHPHIAFAKEDKKDDTKKDDPKQPDHHEEEEEPETYGDDSHPLDDLTHFVKHVSVFGDKKQEDQKDQHHDDDNDVTHEGHSGGDDESPIKKKMREEEMIKKDEEKKIKKETKTKNGTEVEKEKKIEKTKPLAPSNGETEKSMKKFVENLKEVKKQPDNSELIKKKKLLAEKLARIEKVKKIMNAIKNQEQKCPLKRPSLKPPANLFLSQDDIKSENIWKMGVNVLLQSFTTSFGFGNHCFHQIVLAKATFTIYFKEYTREPILVTLFDSRHKLLKKVYQDTGYLQWHTEHTERLHVCFKHDQYHQRKVFIIMEVEPDTDRLNDPKIPVLVQMERRISGNIRRISAMVHYRIARYTIESSIQNEYLSIMRRRSVFLVGGALLILLLQVYFIHYIFETPSAPSYSVPYRMVSSI